MLHGSDDLFVVSVDLHVGDGMSLHGIPVEGVGRPWSGCSRLHAGPEQQHLGSIHLLETKVKIIPFVLVFATAKQVNTAKQNSVNRTLAQQSIFF